MLYIVFDIDDEEDRPVRVLSEDLVDLDIVGLEGVTSCVPSHKFLLLTDLHNTGVTLRIIANMDSWKR